MEELLKKIKELEERIESLERTRANDYDSSWDSGGGGM